MSQCFYGRTILYHTNNWEYFGGPEDVLCTYDSTMFQGKKIYILLEKLCYLIFQHFRSLNFRQVICTQQLSIYSGSPVPCRMQPMMGAPWWACFWLSGYRFIISCSKLTKQSHFNKWSNKKQPFYNNYQKNTKRARLKFNRTCYKCYNRVQVFFMCFLF